MKPLLYACVIEGREAICALTGMGVVDRELKLMTGCGLIAHTAVLAQPDAITCEVCRATIAKVMRDDP